MSSRNLELYQYEPLRPNEISVLYIRMAKSPDDLVCGIYHTTLSAIDYIVISYAWDHDSYNNKIVDIPLVDVLGGVVQGGEHDGKPCTLFAEQPKRYLSIKSSMLEMLLSIGKIGEPNVDFVTAFWIDQISINQLDNKEKSAQVSIMHYIYEEATKTFVYLGEPIFNTDLAFEVAYALAALDEIDEDKIPLEPGPFSENYPTLYPTLDWVAVRKVPTYTPRCCDLLRPSPNSHLYVFGVDFLGRR